MPIMLRAYRTMYSILIFTSTAFLTGSILSFPYKYVITLLALASLAALLWRSNVRLSMRTVLPTAGILALILLSTNLGLFEGFPPSDVLKALASILSPLLILLLYNRHFIEPKTVLASALAGSVVYSIMKVIIVSMTYSGHLSFSALYIDVERLFGYRFVSELISNRLIRVYTVNDLFVAFTPVLLIGRHRLIRSRLINVLLLIIQVVSIYLSFSRYLMLIFLLVTTFVGLASSPKKISFTIKVLMAFVLAFFVLKTIDPGLFGTFINRFNFASVQNHSSDTIRAQQYTKLVAFLAERPFIGWGIGSHVYGFIRSQANPYSYELQLLSLTFQLGVLTMVMVMVMVLYIIFHLLGGNRLAQFLVILAFSSGLLNPYIESSIFGVIVLCLVVMSQWTIRLHGCSASSECSPDRTILQS